ncbi:MAG: NAD(P)/FAD-dependent oxidoreductase [Akkermansiaceae bacterium]|nr:NAD(P)/FAD-dependent oxidoreductase [Akkermansiaceae bacterium]
MSPEKRPHVVVLGGGFAGITAIKELAKHDFDITLVDRRNHHLFQPLLYQVATAGLSAPDIAQPLRHLFSGHDNVTTLMDEVESIDPKQKRVNMKGHDLNYDYLLLGLGAQTGFFGNDSWARHTMGLKTLNEATDIRLKFLTAFEKAEVESDPEERKRLLNFAVIGGGPTGVEMAGAMAELARRVLVEDFRRIDPSHATIHLVEAADRLMLMYDEELSEYTRKRLEDMGVSVHLNKPVTGIHEGLVEMGDESLEVEAIIWAAGVEANRVTRNMGDLPLERDGRIKVEDDLSVPGHPEVFAIGDIASIEDDKGQQVPGVAPAAMQMGKHAAKQLIAEQVGKPRKPFHYFDKGSMATIGRSSAIAQFAGLQIRGFLAWIAWLAIHLLFLMGMRNRLSVFINWMWSYISWQKGARIITGQGYVRTPRPLAPGYAAQGSAMPESSEEKVQS